MGFEGEQDDELGVGQGSEAEHQQVVLPHKGVRANAAVGGRRRHPIRGDKPLVDNPKWVISIGSLAGILL